MNIINCCPPVSLGAPHRIGHIAFDGCRYAAPLLGQCAIVTWDTHGQTMETIPVCRQYECLCYDWCSNCFWASSREHRTAIYQLDQNFHERDFLSIPIPCMGGYVTGLSYHCSGNSLMVSYLDRVVQVEKPSGSASLRFRSCVQQEQILDILSLCNCFLALVNNCEGWFLVTFDADFHRVGRLALEPCWTPQNLVFHPCALTDPIPWVGLLAHKQGCYPYLCRCSLPCIHHPCGQCRACCKCCPPASLPFPELHRCDGIHRPGGRGHRAHSPRRRGKAPNRAERLPLPG